uniref:Uncharacterized protein n=1 Tax=Anolis carolinensis TaxID=28377 RepID=A0A803T1W3_ANOCA
MLWFPGTIPAAIAAAKQRSAVFVVFVEGTGRDDEQSREMAASWEKVTEAATDGFVALKLIPKGLTTSSVLLVSHILLSQTLFSNVGSPILRMA